MLLEVGIYKNLLNFNFSNDGNDRENQTYYVHRFNAFSGRGGSKKDEATTQQGKMQNILVNQERMFDQIKYQEENFNGMQLQMQEKMKDFEYKIRNQTLDINKKLEQQS